MTDVQGATPPRDCPPVSFHPVVRGVYAKRLGSLEAADRFLAADGPFPDPGHLENLSEAADRIVRAVKSGERIALYGHDDPDGITSCAVLAEALEHFDADVDPYIPARAVDGHGLSPELIHRFRHRGASLLVTTDGCSMNVAEVELAASLRLDVIVTDHHEIAERRLAVPGLVNPKAQDDPSMSDLTGVGVAALLAREVLQRAGSGDQQKADNRFCRLLDLIALGTIADYGDLGQNNRDWIVRGLSLIARGDRTAVSIVRRALGIGPDGVFRVEKASRLAAAFASVPSTAGASAGLRALLGRGSWAGDVDDLVKAFLRMEETKRRAIERGRQLAAEIGVDRGEPAVLRVHRIDSRLLGSMATDIVNRSGRPAAVLATSGDGLVAELRAPEGVHLVELLGAMRDLMTSWGGHRAAAGFSASRAHEEEILRHLREAFAATPIGPASPPKVDAEIRRSDIDLLFSRSLRAAMPFGKGNPVPVFRVRDYRRGGTLQELDEREGIGIRLFETGFSERSEAADPLVTFQPRGGGGLAARFVAWAEPATAGRSGE